ncbi:MAG: hypothetical protein IKW84_06230 [Bacteroidaceae bacterium]|nr:hypothetical protein [Bacteroidaceae bacterium]
MNSKKGFLLVFLSVLGCKTVSITNENISDDEIYVSVNSKIPSDGTFLFLLRKEEGIDNRTIVPYSYSIDLDNKKVTCSKGNEFYLDPKVKGTYLWLTSEQFKEDYSDKYNNALFDCISSKFLEISNEEKMNLLDSLSLGSSDRLIYL